MSGGAMKSSLTLAAIAAICTAAVAGTYQLTRERIAANEQAFLEQSLEPALSGTFFEGSVTESMLVIPAPHDLPGDDNHEEQDNRWQDRRDNGADARHRATVP